MRPLCGRKNVAAKLTPNCWASVLRPRFCAHRAVAKKRPFSELGWGTMQGNGTSRSDVVWTGGGGFGCGQNGLGSTCLSNACNGHPAMPSCNAMYNQHRLNYQIGRIDAWAWVPAPILSTFLNFTSCFGTLGEGPGSDAL